ncbi:MAG: hypothetical protein WAW61_09120 [Methylococcaceae bacterium]
MQTSFQVAQPSGEPGQHAEAEFFKTPVFEIGLRVHFFPAVSGVERHRPDQCGRANAWLTP